MNWGTSLPDQLFRLIEQDFVRRFPKAPIALPRFDSGSFPDPSGKYEGTLIYCTDTQDVRYSDGSSWSAL